MKRIMTRSLCILFVTIFFSAGIIFLGVKLVVNNSKWAQQPYNEHIASSGGFGKAGNILDRGGNLLAYSKNGERLYNDDLATREALLHVVGDESLNISTAIQSMYKSKLSGYSFFLGLGVPDSLRPNNDVTLTVDSASCKAAYEALSGHTGACVVYNYKTGEVLCDVSTPTYDPADPPKITPENEAEYSGVYLDNVVSSTFTPGSVFKIITAAAAIENIPNIDTIKFTCEGELDVEGHPIRCADGEVHGEQTLSQAFSNSCNCAFAQIALMIGEDKLKETADKFGFNKSNFRMSDIPIVADHYDATGKGENYLAWSGIGQFEDMANPMHMAMICSAVANSGKETSPYIVEDNGNLLSKLGINVNKAGDVDMISASTASKLQTLMRDAAAHYGEEYGVSIAGLKFCAKTGTAEVGDGKEPTSWFVGYIDDPNHPYAFAAVVAEGGYGVEAATPVVDAAISALVSQ